MTYTPVHTHIQQKRRRIDATTHESRTSDQAQAEPMLQSISTVPAPEPTKTKPDNSMLYFLGRIYVDLLIIVSPVQIISMVWTLIAWLHLTCGVSRNTCTKTLRFILALVLHAMRLGANLQASGLPIDLKEQRTTIPSIVAYLSLDPVLMRSICCPTCFTIYSFQDCPDQCPRRATPRSRPCGASLWKMRHLGGHEARKAPARLYLSQDFESWISWFLSREDIYTAIQESYSHQKPQNGMMEDIWDSPAWESLGDFCVTQGNLTFSYYMDWFNPFMNKIGGKHVSSGVIMMFCLNLPPELRHKPENIFVAGMTPPGKEPTVVTITNVANPVIEQLVPFYHGKTIPTYAHPEGETIKAGVLPLLGDAPAVRKAGGFASHSATQVCSFCTCTLDNIDCLDRSMWMPRTGFEARTGAYQWARAKTKRAQTESFQATGFRWSALHLFEYREHVKHTVLGIMHNWIEGILQHHSRIVWGIDSGKKKSRKTAHHTDATEDTDSGVESDSLSEFNEYSYKSSDPPSMNRSVHTFGSYTDDTMGIDDSLSAGDCSEVDDNYSNSDAGAETNESDTEETSIEKHQMVFTKDQLNRIQAGIADTMLPAHVERPPTNFGEAQHGKLKADHWVTLFTILLPMPLVELWYASESAHDRALLQNLQDLVFCTLIVCSFATNNEAADQFDEHYIRYRQSLKELFPHHRSMPNHHFAMHIGDQLKFWGPLFGLSEFAYERMNGLLQKIKKNYQLRESLVYIDKDPHE